MSLLPLLLLPVLMYFLLIRPQQKKVKAQQALLGSIEEGDEVMTSAGIYGFVTAIDGDVMWVEIAEGVDIRVNRGAIGRKVLVTDGEADTDPGATDAGHDSDVHDTDVANGDSAPGAKASKDDAEG